MKQTKTDDDSKPKDDDEQQSPNSAAIDHGNEKEIIRNVA